MRFFKDLQVGKLAIFFFSSRPERSTHGRLLSDALFLDASWGSSGSLLTEGGTVKEVGTFYCQFLLYVTMVTLYHDSLRKRAKQNRKQGGADKQLRPYLTICAPQGVWCDRVHWVTLWVLIWERRVRGDRPQQGKGGAQPLYVAINIWIQLSEE